MMSEELQKYIRGDITETNTETIEATAKAQGMVTLLQAGVLAALDGRTTLEEVNRAIQTIQNIMQIELRYNALVL